MRRSKFINDRLMVEDISGLREFARCRHCKFFVRKDCESFLGACHIVDVDHENWNCPFNRFACPLFLPRLRYKLIKSNQLNLFYYE